MSAWAIALVVIGALVVVAIIVVLVKLARRRALRARFGPEYEWMVVKAGSPRRAASMAHNRIKERRALDVHPLDAESRDRYGEEWRDVQARFVDAPAAAVRDADSLVTRMMRDRGYPTDDFEHQAAVIYVDHPSVVYHYREGHRAYVSSVNGTASTEEMRRGFVAYRLLFGELLDDQTDTGAAMTG